MSYNMSPNKCMKEWFIFFALVIWSPKKPKKQMNIFLRLLMEKLKELWQGIHTYDNHLKYKFNLRDAYLCSIYDYLAYDKFIGWYIHSRLNCPVCMDESDAFSLWHCRKVSFFDCHRRFLHLSHEFRVIKSHFRHARGLEMCH
jgi:hypothetical protein